MFKLYNTSIWAPYLSFNLPQLIFVTITSKVTIVTTSGLVWQRIFTAITFSTARPRPVLACRRFRSTLVKRAGIRFVTSFLTLCLICSLSFFLWYLRDELDWWHFVFFINHHAKLERGDANDCNKSLYYEIHILGN